MYLRNRCCFDPTVRERKEEVITLGDFRWVFGDGVAWGRDHREEERRKIRP